MPPQTREEVRHELLVSILLNGFERTYEESGEVPRSRWLPSIVNYHLIPYRNYNFTEAEKDDAASEAMEKFELKHRPHLFFVPYIIGDIIEDVLDLVIGPDYELPDELDAEQYDLNDTPHAALGGSTPLQILKDDPSTWPESWHRGNRLADVD